MRSKFPEYVVKRMVGHSLGNMEMVNTHLTDEEMQKYASQLGGFLSKGFDLTYTKSEGETESSDISSAPNLR